MTNLEKLEMKYKIVQLQGELNSLRFVNGKQKTVIDQLKKENSDLKKKLDEKLAVSARKGSEEIEENKESDSKSVLKGSESKSSSLNATLISEYDEYAEIPEIDLLIIKKSRQQLTKSMKEIVQLLKTPSVKSVNYLDLPDPHGSNVNEFDVLFEHQDHDHDLLDGDNSFVKSRDRKNYKDNSVVALFFGDRAVKELIKIHDDDGEDDDDEKGEGIDAFSQLEKRASQLQKRIEDENQSNQAESAFSVRFLEPSDLLSAPKETIMPSSLTDESDTETVVIDESREDDDYEELAEPNVSPVKPVKHTNISLSESGESDLTPPAEGGYKSFSYGIYSTKIRKPESNSSPEYEVTITDSDEQQIFDKKIQLSISFDKISLLYPIVMNGVVTSFLLVEADGSIQAITLDSDEPEKLLYNLRSSIHDVQSDALIEFTPKTTETSKSYGLAVSGVSQTGQFVLRVFQITYDTSVGFVSKEIGNYNRSFLTKSKANEDVEFVGWIASETELASSKLPVSPRSRVRHSDKKGLFCDDVSLSPYKLLYKVGSKWLELNIVLKQTIFVKQPPNIGN